MKPKKVVILGAGITGLSAAWRLASAGVPVEIIEKHDDVGGLSMTVDWDGWKFDYGPHNFHTHDSGVIDFYRELLKENFRERDIDVRLRIFDKLVSYPMVGIDVLTALDSVKMAKASTDFLLTRAKAFLCGIPTTEFLDEWIKLRFGKILYETYFGPYIRRIWETDPHRLSKSVGEYKIPIMSIRNYIKRLFLKNKKIDPHDVADWKSYYVRQGIGQLSEHYVSELKKMPHVSVRLGAEVTAIHVTNNKIVSVETKSEKINLDSSFLISTVPLEFLLQHIPELPEPIRPELNVFEYCSERFLFVRVRKPKVSGYEWTYFSDDRYPFNRVSEFNHDFFEMVPNDCSSLTFELPCDESDWLWNISDDELMDVIFPLYSDVFDLEKNEIMDYRSGFQKRAYPRLIVGYEKVIRNVFQYLGNIGNLYSVGRQGMFCYLNMDGATRMGLDTAEAILKSKKPDEGYVELLKKYHPNVL